MAIVGNSASEIFESIRALVQQGELKPGSTLPPVRDLAEQLAVNRNTVASAYRRLTQAGIALSQGRLGTTIRDVPRAGEQEGLNGGTALVDLAAGNPNPAWLPDPREALAGSTLRPCLYGEPIMDPAMEAIGRRWLTPDCPNNSVLTLTYGAVDAIERLAAAHLVAGDKVVVEDPCFLGTINALRLAGMHAIGARIDDLGMVPDALDAALADGAQAVLITPRAHNPTGCSLTKRRADALKRVLDRYPNALVIVDDHFALLAETPYHSVIPASANRWALIRSVSKALGPDLRVAFVACDPRTADRLHTRLAPGMTWVSHILQAMVAACLSSSESVALVENARQQYAHRRNELSAALKSRGIATVPATGGLNVWIPLEQDPKEITYALALKGWLVRSSTAFDVQDQSQAIRITVSLMQDGQAEQFSADLKACLG